MSAGAAVLQQVPVSDGETSAAAGERLQTCAGKHTLRRGQVSMTMVTGAGISLIHGSN